MAQQTNSSNAYSTDPILNYRPPFAQSLPVQILLTGIVLTLTSVLLLHLIFTAQYHWPLARNNYILQLTGVTTLLISLVATIYVIFSTAVQQSQHWPYMLSYLAVDMPSANYSLNSTDPTLAYQHRWTAAESATWVVMNATTNVIVQITHIQFLTLLYPSYLEARLIFGLLGPLAILSAAMQLLPVICGSEVVTIAEGTRNVCNATLSLLFTSSLIIWGFFVNRRQAWRTDGGTAAFGAGAIMLAVLSTCLNFIYIPRQDQYTWMPKLMWAITLWQSFLGWWWWVGAGMGVREVEELLQRETKRQRKRQLREQRRKGQREKARSVWKGVTGALKPAAWADQLGYGGQALSSRERADGVSRIQSRDGTSSVGASTSTVNNGFLHPAHCVQQWFARLRQEHLVAAHTQAIERGQRARELLGREGDRNADEFRTEVIGWGLGSYSLREAERERREGMEMEQRTPQNKIDVEGEDEEEWKDVPISSQRGPDDDQRLRHRHGEHTQLPTHNLPAPAVDTDAQAAGSSFWWWGPLRRWRLQDSTTYR